MSQPLPVDPGAAALPREGNLTPQFAPGPRPAHEVLGADPIPVGVSVVEGMPGRPLTREELSTGGAVLVHDTYVVQLRDSGTWILPNHDDGADLTNGRVAVVLRRVIDDAPSRTRAALDTDGTVYLSNGRQAARYIPTALISGYRTGQCPGCHTSYTHTGDGPCSDGRSTGFSKGSHEAY